MFGVGFNNFTEYHELTAHNSLVLPIAELGIVGFGIWFAFVWYCGYMLFWLAYRYPSIPALAATPAETAVKAATGRAALAVPGAAQVAREISAARGLSLAGLGFIVGAFFLSQSYKFTLFILAGLAMGRYIGAGEALPGLRQFSLAEDWAKLVGFAILAPVTFWLIVKVLL